MKKVILLFVIFSIGFSLMSCEPENVTKGRKVYMEYFNSTLRDPESLKIYSEKVKKIDDYQYIFIVDYGAKNGYGAMNRKTITFETLGNHLTSVDGDSGEAIEFESEKGE